jgi:dimethylaniline monooxygenase (N-oxide forming)
VYRADPIALKEKTILLADGRELQTDCILCGTGWDPSYNFIPPQLRRELGLPHHPREGEANEEATWQKLMDEADRSVLEEYPMLAAPPLRQGPRPDPSVTPVRLYHAMAALDNPSIVFTGRPKFVHNFRLAETQAIWATAYFDGHITLPKREELQKRVAYMNALSRRRYPSKGADGVNLMPEFIWYTDYLLQQAGLSSHRKSWFEDPDEPAFNSDLRDCRDEYLAKYRAVNGSEVA